MSGACICTRRGQVGYCDPRKPIAERKYKWFCSPDHESTFSNMGAIFLERFEINAIIGLLPQLGQALAAKGLTEKSFSTMTKDEICSVVADVIKAYRESLDREAEMAKEIPF